MMDSEMYDLIVSEMWKRQPETDSAIESYEIVEVSANGSWIVGIVDAKNPNKAIKRFLGESGRYQVLDPGWDRWEVANSSGRQATLVASLVCEAQELPIDVLI